MTTLIIITAIWGLGYAVAYLMQRTEIAADQEVFTTGSRLLVITFSLLSFIMVLIMLIRGWSKMISMTGYWEKPVKQITEEVQIKKTKPVLN